MDNQQANVLLSSAYLAPVQYFTKLISYQIINLEYCESYLKQSYMNRTVILSVNGPLKLSLPIVNGPRAKGMIRDQQLSYEYHWQQMHWRGISSAYNNSPFFQYYSDNLAPFYHEKKWKYLVDFNFEIQKAVMKSINFDVTIKCTDDYCPRGDVPETTDDFRCNIHPKPQKQIGDKRFSPTIYTQVFHDKWGFVPNLSILDLLFNEGPETLLHLRSCIR